MKKYLAVALLVLGTSVVSLPAAAYCGSCCYYTYDNCCYTYGVVPFFWW